MRRKNKYNARKVTINGKVCDSMMEGEHYKKLLLAEKNGSIGGLKLHPRYNIEIKGVKICAVVLDFEYYDVGVHGIKSAIHYVDVKGFYTSISKLKHKMFEAYYGDKVEIWKK